MLELGPFQQKGTHPLKTAYAAVSPSHIALASGFATEAGLDYLRSELIGRKDFDAAEVQVLVGIYGGVSQPELLQRLYDAPNVDVRVPFGTETLEFPGLRPKNFFHPKIFAFANPSAGTIAIVTGSANLTYGGLRGNVENLWSFTGLTTDREAVAFKQWWNSTWSAAHQVTPAFMEKYVDVRPKLPTPGGIPKPTPNGPARTTLWKAKTLWIELVRKPEGGSFNQAELLLTAHHFFYPGVTSPSKTTKRHLSFVDAAGQQYRNKNRSISFNGPPERPGGNSMWRVYMPTAREGFTGYQDGDVFLRFDRTPEPDHYRISVAETNSPQTTEWMESFAGIATKAGAVPRRMGWM